MMNNQVIKLCEILKLGDLISTPTRVTGGLLHLMWHIKTCHGEYAIKELNKTIVTSSEVKSEYEITEKIARQFVEKGISAIASFSYNGHSLIEIEDSILIVYPWISGQTLQRDEVSQSHAEKIGVVLAHIHQLNLSFPELRHPEWGIHTNDIFCKLANRALLANLPFAAYLKENLDRIISWNNLYQTSIPILNSHLVVSHGDLDQKNVIWDHNLNPHLIDWESARLLNPTQEILNAALDWSGVTSGQVNVDVFKSVLAAYKKQGGKLNKEQASAAIWAIVGNWLNWMKYNIKRSLGDHVLGDEERQLGIQQVQVVLNTLLYLTDNINHFNSIVNELYNI